MQPPSCVFLPMVACRATHELQEPPMPVVNREVVLPCDRERAWELITEPAELEGWLADEVEFEAEEDAPLRVIEGGRPRGRRRGGHRGRADRVPLGRLPRRVGARGRVPAAPASSSPSTASWPTRSRGARSCMALARAPRRSACAWRRRGLRRALATRRGARSCARSRSGRTLTASRLAGELPITRQAVAKHLAALQRAGLVEPRREGRETRYTLTPAPLVDAMGWMAEVGADWDQRLARLVERARG